MTEPPPTRLHPLRVLESPMRAAMVAAVLDTPGLFLGELAARVGCSRATARHHLKVLRRAGLLSIVSWGRRTAVFPATMQTAEQDAWAALQRGRTMDLARLVRAEPGLVQKEITARLGLTRKMLRRYVDALVLGGLLQELEDPPFRTYHPTPLLGLLLDLGTPAGMMVPEAVWIEEKPDDEELVKAATAGRV
jgi:predicted transcriptional regulator